MRLLAAEAGNYTTTYSGDCGPTGIIPALTLGQNATCTITNTKASWVRVVKTVGGGAS